MGIPLDDSLSSSLLIEDIISKESTLFLVIIIVGKPAYSHNFEIA